MKRPPLGAGQVDITSPDWVAPRGRKTSSTRNLKTQNPKAFCVVTFQRATPIGCRISAGPFQTMLSVV